MIIVQIETLQGVENVEEIAAVEGVDIVFAASSDLASFSGYRPGDPEYEALITKIHDATLAAGKWLGGPLNWYNRDGFQVFQAPSEGSFIKTGVREIIERFKNQ